MTGPARSDSQCGPERGRLRFGTSSWSEKTWGGVFYPRGLRPAEYLTHYATCFDAVEADVTYYRIPDENMVRGWDRKTPPGFSLAAKFPRSIVHAGEGPRPDPARVLVPEHVGGDIEEFLSAMSLLGAKCGPLVVQFPFFSRACFPDPQVFLDRLDAFLAGLPTGFRYAVEVRNCDWVGEPLLEVLRRHRAAFVWVEIAHMPHPGGVAARFDTITADFTYARLIGDRAALDRLTKTFDRVVVDQGPRLERWATLVRDSLGRVPETFVFANNHYAGHGPATIRDLARRVLGADTGPPEPAPGPEKDLFP